MAFDVGIEHGQFAAELADRSFIQQDGSTADWSSLDGRIGCLFR